LSAEPQTLYPFAAPEPGRQHILAALEDDVLAQPPSLRVENVTVRAGESVVDGLGRVQAATPGVVLTLLEGEVRVLEEAAKWQLPQMRVRFILRPNLQWSDGAPLTAADFALGFETARAAESFDARRTVNERTATFRALSDTELEWLGLPGFITPTYTQHLWPPLPRHQPLEQITAGRAPLSYGPFQFAEWRAGEFIRMERNPFYWRAAEGLPYLQSVVYRFDAQNCEVIPSGQMIEIGELGDWRIERLAGPRTDYLHFNLALAQLADGRVRQALGACAKGDSSSASRVLEELGWVDGNADGAREQNNQPLAFSLSLSPQTDEALAENLAQNFLACGVNVTAQTLTEGEWLADWPEGVLFGRRFELALVRWPHINGRFPCEVWQTEQIASAANPAGVNVSGYSNAEFDAACRRVQTALDAETLAAWEAQAWAIIERDVPAVEVGRSTRAVYVRPGVSGIQFSASVASELWALEAVRVAP
jgi:peptide/nickel transport system substrate-binding protein